MDVSSFGVEFWRSASWSLAGDANRLHRQTLLLGPGIRTDCQDYKTEQFAAHMQSAAFKAQDIEDGQRGGFGICHGPMPTEPQCGELHRDAGGALRDPFRWFARSFVNIQRQSSSSSQTFCLEPCAMLSSDSGALQQQPAAEASPRPATGWQQDECLWSCANGAGLYLWETRPATGWQPDPFALSRAGGAGQQFSGKARL